MLKKWIDDTKCEITLKFLFLSPIPVHNAGDLTKINA